MYADDILIRFRLIIHLHQVTKCVELLQGGRLLVPGTQNQEGKHLS